MDLRSSITTPTAHQAHTPIAAQRAITNPDQKKLKLFLPQIQRNYGTHVQTAQLLSLKMASDSRHPAVGHFIGTGTIDSVDNNWEQTSPVYDLAENGIEIYGIRVVATVIRGSPYYVPYHNYRPLGRTSTAGARDGLND